MDVEKLLFRTILAGVTIAVVATVIASTDDIKRYIRMKQM